MMIFKMPLTEEFIGQMLHRMTAVPSEPFHYLPLGDFTEAFGETPTKIELAFAASKIIIRLANDIAGHNYFTFEELDAQKANIAGSPGLAGGTIPAGPLVPGAGGYPNAPGRSDTET